MPAPTGAVLAPVEGVPAVVTLRPGQIRFAKEPAVVRTVPGSRLSATMHCARPGAGAICHALFPGGGPPAGDEAFRNVDRSIAAMAARGLGAAAGDVGGTAGRTLYFFSLMGDVYVKRLADGPGDRR